MIDKYEDKTKEQLIEEIKELRQKIKKSEPLKTSHTLDELVQYDDFKKEIGERRRVEEKLKNERQRFFSLLDELPALVYLQAPDYSIRYANRYFREHFGDPTGKYCHEVLMKCKKPCHECPTFRVFETQKPQHWDITTPDGKNYDIYDYPFTDVDGSLLVLDLSIDATEKKKMEQELQKSEERWRKYFELGLIGIAVTTPEKAFTAVNDWLCEICGYSRDELMKMTWAELIYPDDLESIVSEFNQLLVGEINRIKKEMRSIRKDGTVITISVSAKCLHRQDRSVDSVLVFVQDITELKKTMEQIQYRLTIDETLAQASKLLISSEKGDFHEVLKIVGEAIAADRAYIFRLRDNRQKADMIYEWCSPGTKSQIDNLQDIEPAQFPWLMNKLMNGESIVISDIGDLPPEARLEKEEFQTEDIRSLLGVPFYSQKGTLLGFIGFDDTKKCRNWAHEDIQAMHIIAEMIGTYLERRHTEKLLQESEYKYSTLVEHAQDAIVIYQDWILTFANDATLNLTGFTIEELIGKSIAELLAPEVREKYIPRELVKNMSV